MSVEHRGRTFTVRMSDARAGLVAAYMEIVEGDEVVGYLTEYGNSESGAVPAHLLGYGLPQIFRSLEAALDHIAP